MVIHGQVVEVAYNVQTVVDDKHSLVVDYQATNLNDRKALHEMASRARRIVRAGSLKALADKGYHNGELLAACQEDGIITFVAHQEAPRPNPVPAPEYYGDRFRYNRSRDTYTCPQGHEMSTPDQWYQKKYDDASSARVKHYRTPKCKTCPARLQCTTNASGRIIERSEYAEAVEKNLKRVRKHKGIYAARQQIIEHVFGTIKRSRCIGEGYDHILLKGLRKNDGEFGLIYFTYNIRLLMAILGVEGIKKWAKKLIFVKMWLRHSRERCGGMLSLNYFLATGRCMQSIVKVRAGFCTNCR